MDGSGFVTPFVWSDYRATLGETYSVNSVASA